MWDIEVCGADLYIYSPRPQTSIPLLGRRDKEAPWADWGKGDNKGITPQKQTVFAAITGRCCWLNYPI